MVADARIVAPWATDAERCRREMRPGDLVGSQALYACAKHAGPGIIADAVRNVYVIQPRWFARFADEEFHALMTGGPVS